MKRMELLPSELENPWLTRNLMFSWKRSCFDMFTCMSYEINFIFQKR